MALNIFSILSIGKLKFSSQSKNHGFALLYIIALALAAKVYEGKITLSPSLIPIDFKATCRAEVPEFNATEYLKLYFSLNLSSNFFTNGPAVETKFVLRH